MTLQHPSPYYDDSYDVNSANEGPYDDAILQELIPEVERRFRVIGQPWARLLTGGSTGGWISLAQQVFHPDFYGGTWSLCPDAVDFRYHQIVNIYEDTNAYWVNHGWMKVDRPDVRRPDGNIVTMMKDENWYELTVGDHSRSGGQWDIWEAAYGPVGADGYPQRIWNKQTGVIDHAVAEYWKQHFDLRHRLETNWRTVGPKLADKLNVYVGAMRHVLPERRRASARRLPQPRDRPQVDRRDRLSAARPALLGAAAAGAAAEDGGAHAEERAGGRRHEELAVLIGVLADLHCRLFVLGRRARRRAVSRPAVRAGAGAHRGLQ